MIINVALQASLRNKRLLQQELLDQQYQHTLQYFGEGHEAAHNQALQNAHKERELETAKRQHRRLAKQRGREAADRIKAASKEDEYPAERRDEARRQASSAGRTKASRQAELSSQEQAKWDREQPGSVGAAKRVQGAAAGTSYRKKPGVVVVAAVQHNDPAKYAHTHFHRGDQPSRAAPCAAPRLQQQQQQQ